MGITSEDARRGKEEHCVNRLYLSVGDSVFNTLP